MKEAFDIGSGGFFDLSSRAKYRVRGSDRTRFLNGQITNDLRGATEKEAIEACILDTKGKINAHVFISAEADAYLLDAEAGSAETLPARLERYIIADDVEVEDITTQYGIFHILTSAAPKTENDWRTVRTRRFADPGWDVLVEMPALERARKFFSSNFLAIDEEQAEILRMESGLPRWGRELSSDIIPIEANLEKRCIDYLKGCYIGQEVISRMKTSGQTNKRLCGIVPLSGDSLVSGMHLKTLLEPVRDAGWLTSVGYSSKLGKQIALGFVKRGFNTPGTHLNASLLEQSADRPAISVEVVPLPFV